MDKLHIQAPQLDRLSRLDDIHFYLSRESVLFELSIHQPKGQHGAINRQIDPLEQIRQRADVILMPMSKHNSTNLICVAFYKCKVWQHQIYSEHIVIGERHPAVDDHHVPFTFIQGEVFSDLIQTAQKVNSNRWFLASAVLSAFFASRRSRFCFFVSLHQCLFRVCLFCRTTYGTAFLRLRFLG